MPAETPNDTPLHPYPGGENAPGYRLAFQVWIILFLLVIIIGLLNYLASWLKNVVG